MGWNAGVEIGRGQASACGNRAAVRWA
jgi:hypothetical protein